MESWKLKLLISSQIKPAKFETFKTETYFRLKNSFSCQKTKFAGQELIPFLDIPSYELLNQVSNNNADFENASFARSANGRIATTYDDEGMKILWH